MPDVRKAVASPALAPATRDADLARGRLMQAALKDLLNRVRGARDVLPHLAALETALGRQGVAAIGGIAPLWLSKMYSQLSSLPIAANEPLLLDLRQRLLEAVQPRAAGAPYKSTLNRVAGAAGAAGAAGGTGAASANSASPVSPRAAPPREYLSTFDSDSRMMVGEISHTDFMREIDAAESPGG